MKFRIDTAKKSGARARIALCGPPGSGKTFTALEIARGLTDNHDRIIVIDSERGSSSRYADGEWRLLELPDYKLTTYMEAIAYAEGQCDVLIVDSISQAWSGEGGALEQADQLQKRGNKMQAWQVVTPLYNKFVNALVGCKAHLVATMRTKNEWIFENRGGKQTPKIVGTKPVQREGIEYEFDIVADMTAAHELVVNKTRCTALDGLVAANPGQEIGQTIREWLSDAEPRQRVEVQELQPSASISQNPPVKDDSKPDALPHLVKLSNELRTELPKRFKAPQHARRWLEKRCEETDRDVRSLEDVMASAGEARQEWQEEQEQTKLAGQAAIEVLTSLRGIDTSSARTLLHGKMQKVQKGRRMNAEVVNEALELLANGDGE